MSTARSHDLPLTNDAASPLRDAVRPSFVKGLLQDSPGKRLCLLGNLAIVRGAVEAGVQFYSCYPGTPSSEISDTIGRLACEAGILFEYSVNEERFR